jgi:hypothetical protein
MSHLDAIRRLLEDVRHGQACRFISRDTREAAERALSAIEAVLASAESNASAEEDGTVKVPLWVLNRLRSLREPLPANANCREVV